MKIGELVKSYIPKIFEYCKNVDPKELEKLMDKDYSNKTFGINFPFCEEEGSQIVLQESKRFWKNIYKVNERNYRVSSQWLIGHKIRFLNYLLKHNLINQQKYNELILNVQPKMVLVDHKQVGLINLDEKLKLKVNRGLIETSQLSDESNIMGIQYQKFYCLERSIRQLVREVMSERYDDNWWVKVDSRVRDNVKSNLEYELDTSHTKRSEHKIDYTTFGDLRKILNAQWEIFKPKFNRNLNSVNEVMIDLNRLRVPIAHCTPLAEKEIKRLEIRIDDWYDLLKK